MENIRNFCIIAHIDHGKSTLADRFLEITRTISGEKMRPQFLDAMDLESEKGITIKMHPVRMDYVYNGKPYVLNLIDTPGHADFSYEVSRSLAAVEGAILLVDATQGIQAQTIYNYELAKKQKLLIIPAVNKVDSPQAKTAETKMELANLLGVSEEEVFEVSAKTGLNVEKLLQTVIDKVPPPAVNSEGILRALIFDSKYNPYQGVIVYLRLVDGKIRAGERILLMQNNLSSEVKEVGYFRPELQKAQELVAGEAGYLATGIKEPGKVRVGDTITDFQAASPGSQIKVQPLPGYKEPMPVVFASIFPENPDDFELLKESLSKLKLNDASLTFEVEQKESLGRGFRCGFLGSLHAEIVSERLKREFGLDLVISSPSVVFKIINQKDKELPVFSASDWPSQNEIKEAHEPWARLEVITPVRYLGDVLLIMEQLKGNSIETKYFGEAKTILIYEVPLKGLIAGFYDRLKEVSQGFASMSYEILPDRKAELTKLEILIAGKKEEAFSRIIYSQDAFKEGERMTRKLKDILPAQLFSVAIQAAIGGKIIARSTISAKGRDVIAPLYGGDYTRKKKLLEQQKKGKKELKEKGQVHIPSQVFLEMFKS